MNKTTVNEIGWIGVILIIIAYAGITFGFLKSDNICYLLLNIIGSIFVAYEAYIKRDNQPVILNIIWALVAVFGLIKFFAR